MYNNSNSIQGQELILQPQKLAFDSEINLEKQYNSFEHTTHQQNRLKDLLHYQFAFEPNYFEMPNRINYKSNKVDLVAEDFLPSVKMDTKVIKKIQSLLRDGLNKQFFLNGSSFESSSHDLVHQTFYLDKVSFDFEDSFEKSFYGRHEYSLTCFCIGDANRTMKPSKIMQEQLKEAIKGISSFQGIDFSESQEYQYRKTDLLYLNHFRVFLFFENSPSQKDQYKIHRYLYYPRINFTAQLISQPFRLVSTPIAAFLTQKIKNSDLSQKEIAKRKNLVRYGFLSLDRSSRMIPLHASDDYCVQIPLVGVWTYGIDFSEDDSCEQSGRRFVWSLLTEFVKNKTIAQRFTYNQQQKSFILAVFNLDNSAKYYEICIQDQMDDDEDEDIQFLNQQNLNQSNLQNVSRKWCMIKNYSNSTEQQQIQMNYSTHSDIASKLSLEYPFRYCSKMVVNYFDDDEFFKNIRQLQMKQSQVVQQQQQQQQYQQIQKQQQQLNQIASTNNNNKQTVKRTSNNSSNQMNNNNKQKQQLQQTVTNNKNLEQEESESNHSIQQNKLGQIKSQMLELQKQDDFFLESQKSVQSASFANNQTFSQNLHLNANNENNNKSVESNLQQLPPVAERIIQQQQDQINKMSQQIQQLTEALKQFQTNTSRQIYDNQSQHSFPLSPQSQSKQSQILQNPPPLPYPQNRGQNHPMYKNFPPYPPHYYYDQYHFYPPHPMGPHQYPPYPPPMGGENPYNMYHRAPYYMQESFVSGDGKSSRGGINNMNNINMNNYGGNHQAKRSIYLDNNSEYSQTLSNHNQLQQFINGNFLNNNQQVDAISDIQSIKKEDDVQSEVSQQIVFNNFQAQLKNVTNMVPQPSEEQLSFAHNNNNMFANNLTQRALDQQNSSGSNNINQQNLINQSAQSAQSLQLAQQNSYQSINNQSIQEQSNSLNNGNKKHLRDDSIANEIQKQNPVFANENTFQYKDNQEQNGNVSVRGGRKSEIQFSQQQFQNESLQEKASFESSQEQYSKYSPHLYYGDEQKSNNKQIIHEKMISGRPSIDQSPNNLNYKQQNNLDKLQQLQISLNPYNAENTHNLLTQKDNFDSNNNYDSKSNNETKQKKSPKKSNMEENLRQIKQAMENIPNFESEETFTMDAKFDYKMKVDFLSSVRKPDESNLNNSGKENKNSLNTFSNANVIINNKSSTPSNASSQPSSSSVKTKIPTIKYETYNDSDSDDDEMKKLEKKEAQKMCQNQSNKPFKIEKKKIS